MGITKLWSRTMEYAIYTRGKHNDYRWNIPPSTPFHNYLAEQGIAVYREMDGTFSIYLFFSSKSKENSDSMGRPIGVGCLFTSCDETEAKELTGYALKQWENCYADFARFVRWHDGKDEHWELNSSEIESFIEKTSKKARETPGAHSPFPDRMEDGNTPETRRQLMDELSRFGFSTNPGFKLVVDSEILTGGYAREIIDSADRYYMEKGTRKSLANQVSTEPSTKGKPVTAMKRRWYAILAVSLLFVASLIGNALLFMQSQGRLKVMVERSNRISELNNELAAYQKIKDLNAEQKELEKGRTKLEGEKSKLIGEIDSLKYDQKELKGKLKDVEDNIQKASKERDKLLASNNLMLLGRLAIIEKDSDLWSKITDINMLKSLKNAAENRIKELAPEPLQPLPTPHETLPDSR